MSKPPLDVEVHRLVDHYTGFEGHPAYCFVVVSSDGKQVFRMWEGWFDAMMEQVPFRPPSWTSLALPYHTDEGWFIHSPWRLHDVQAAITQLQAAYRKLQPGESKNITHQLIEFLAAGLRAGHDVFIEYD